MITVVSVVVAVEVLNSIKIYEISTWPAIKEGFDNEGIYYKVLGEYKTNLTL
jgi:hypothetical protein